MNHLFILAIAMQEEFNYNCNYKQKMKEKNRKNKDHGLVRDLNPGPLAPKARIIPLDHWAICSVVNILLPNCIVPRFVSMHYNVSITLIFSEININLIQCQSKYTGRHKKKNTFVRIYQFLVCICIHNLKSLLLRGS